MCFWKGTTTNLSILSALHFKTGIVKQNKPLTFIDVTLIMN